MKVTVTQVIPTKDGLRLALRIESDRAGWLRFGATAVLFEDWSDETCVQVTRWLNRRHDQACEADEPLPLNW